MASPSSDARPGLLRRGCGLLTKRRWQWLALTHIGLAVVLVMYFLMVLANTAGFASSFWNEPPPNDAADRFAVLSLLALGVSVVFVGYVVYGAYCIMLLDSHCGRTTSTLAILRRTLGPALQSWWWGPPLFLVAAASVVLVLPGLTVVPLLAPVPFSVILARKPLVAGHLAFVRSAYHRLLPVSVVTAIVGFAVWQSFRWSFALVERFDGLVEVLVLPISWACYLIVGLAAALAAACTAVLLGGIPAAAEVPV
jgi:hypothetical protein